MTKYTNYQEIITDDGSTTYFSKLYDEACHSTSGAVNETKTHYIDGCEILKTSSTVDTINILEVGFGTGIGFLETRKALEKQKFTFISFEIDLELIQIFSDKMEIQFNVIDDVYSFKTNEYELIILLGDARKTISKIPKFLNSKIHAIYQDAFSPKRNSILWTTQWFSQLLELSDTMCIMSTYSSSSSIRKSMVSAGWVLYEGVKFGPKRSSTRAKLTGETSTSIMDKLNRSPAIEITDDNYQDYHLGNNK